MRRQLNNLGENVMTSLKNFPNGIYLMVSDSVSGDYSNLFKDYDKALKCYDTDGAGGDYDVFLQAIYLEDGEIEESILIKKKTVSK